MASGLPIACSDKGFMLEVLGKAGVYFDPEQPREITSVLRSLIEDPVLRESCAQAAYERSLKYSWERCSQETIDFIADVANSSRPEE
jgi:glycosyltransferase involved in cell wall biosynthesis